MNNPWFWVALAAAMLLGRILPDIVLPAVVIILLLAGWQVLVKSK